MSCVESTDTPMGRPLEKQAQYAARCQRVGINHQCENREDRWKVGISCGITDIHPSLGVHIDKCRLI
jgi:hypothetical protein